MKRILLATLVIMLAALTGCTSALSHGTESSDAAHKFLLHIGQITDQVDTDFPDEGEVFLIIKYEIENLRNQDDSQWQWTDYIKIEADEETYEPVPLDSLADQMWETSLSAGEARTGYIAYAVPDDFEDFDLTFTFPVSGDEVLYVFRPVDRRIGVNAEFVLTRLDQIERTKRIPLIGGLLASISGAPIRHLGEILVPEEEISQLTEQTKVAEEGISEILEHIKDLDGLISGIFEQLALLNEEILRLLQQGEGLDPDEEVPRLLEQHENLNGEASLLLRLIKGLDEEIKSQVLDEVISRLLQQMVDSGEAISRVLRLGEGLDPDEEVPRLLEQHENLNEEVSLLLRLIKGLDEEIKSQVLDEAIEQLIQDAKRAVIEEYLLTHGHGLLE